MAQSDFKMLGIEELLFKKEKNQQRGMLEVALTVWLSWLEHVLAPKGCQFNSQAGHMPQEWVQSW